MNGTLPIKNGSILSKKSGGNTMKKKWKQQVAAVMTAVICSLNPLMSTEIWAENSANLQAEIAGGTTEYVEQGQTVLCLDKGSITIDEQSVSGFDKNGRAVYQVNEKGYCITVSEKGADTSGKKIEISNVSNVSLADIHGGSLWSRNVGKLTIVGEVVLEASITGSVLPILQGEGENAVFDICGEKITSLREIKISNLQLKASEVMAGALKLENSKIYADRISSVEGIVFKNIGANNGNQMPGFIECIGSGIYASECFETYYGRIENSIIETAELSMELREMEASAFQGTDLRPKMEMNHCNIKADEIRISGVIDADFFNSEINTENIYVQTERIKIIQRMESGYGEDKTTEKQVLNYFGGDVKIKFNHCTVTVDAEGPVVEPDEVNGGFVVSDGLDVFGGIYDHAKNEYTDKALCEITIENGSVFLLKRPVSLCDFATMNIDNSTFVVEVHYAGEDSLAIPAIEGYNSDGQTHTQINLADNVMIADGKDIAWVNDGYGWCLDSVPAKGSDDVTNVIKIVPRN